MEELDIFGYMFTYSYEEQKMGLDQTTNKSKSTRQMLLSAAE